MDPDRLRDLLEAVRNGTVRVADASAQLRHLPFEDLGFARVDHHRALRQGVPEVVYAPGKSASQIVEIVRAIRKRKQTVLVTRVERRVANEVRRRVRGLEWHEEAGVLRAMPRKRPAQRGAVAVVTAGTSDLPVAEEAGLTLEAAGVEVVRLADVGVAGLHRLMAVREELERAHVLIVVAGMEGALPSVVGGWSAKPVIAVPTSVGYGANLGGFTALLGMLTSCASGVAVVNIDNGFGAAMAALRILGAIDPKGADA